MEGLSIINANFPKSSVILPTPSANPSKASVALDIQALPSQLVEPDHHKTVNTTADLSLDIDSDTTSVSASPPSSNEGNTAHHPTLTATSSCNSSMAHIHPDIKVREYAPAPSSREYSSSTSLRHHSSSTTNRELSFADAPTIVQSVIQVYAVSINKPSRTYAQSPLVSGSLSDKNLSINSLGVPVRSPASRSEVARKDYPGAPRQSPAMRYALDPAARAADAAIVALENVEMADRRREESGINETDASLQLPRTANPHHGEGLAVMMMNETRPHRVRRATAPPLTEEQLLERRAANARMAGRDTLHRIRGFFVGIVGFIFGIGLMPLVLLIIATVFSFGHRDAFMSKCFLRWLAIGCLVGFCSGLIFIIVLRAKGF